MRRKALFMVLTVFVVALIGCAKRQHAVSLLPPPDFGGRAIVVVVAQETNQEFRDLAKDTARVMLRRTASNVKLVYGEADTRYKLIVKVVGNQEEITAHAEFVDFGPMVEVQGQWRRIDTPTSLSNKLVSALWIPAVMSEGGLCGRGAVFSGGKPRFACRSDAVRFVVEEAVYRAILGVGIAKQGG